MKFSSSLRLAALPLALSAVFPALAQTQLAPVVVTATRVEQPLTDVVADVSIIDREQIEASAGRTLTELLVREAGVQMSANGGLGKSAGLYLRGTNAGHVLLLVDGVRFGSATLGQANWDNIPVDSIERIEVLKGPSAALYGSEAVGGVVQVFTRPGQKGFHPYASVTLGSESHRALAAGFSGGTDEVSYALGASSLSEKGFSATNSRIGKSFNPDRDGFDQDSMSGSIAWRLAPGWRLTASALQSDGVSRSDKGSSAFDVRTESFTQMLAAGLEYEWSVGGRTKFKLSRGEEKATSFGADKNNSTATTRYDTERNQATLQHEMVSFMGAWVFGAESVQENVSSSSAYDVTDRSADSLFIGLNGQKQGHLWQFNLRRDDNSQFGAANTGYLGYGYQFTPQWSLHGGYGTTFKAPSFNDLYWPGAGNPLLEPEKGRSKELALVYKTAMGPVKLTRFDNRIANLIAWAPASTAPDADWIPSNVDRASIQGWLLGHEGGAGLWSWRTQLELLDARDEKTGLKLQRRADRQLSATLGRELADWKLAAHWMGASGRFDDKSNTEAKRLSGYGTLDLSAERAIVQDWRIQFRLNNLTDKVYETVYGYNQPGRAAYVTLRWQGH
jgi:vitamin B12 transporter